MSTGIGLDAGQRWLVVAPHPDDEVLGTGALLAALARAGALVRVLLLTPGDNNPWPQRVLERRWSIGSAERQRWGARRVAECGEALRRLGHDPARVLRTLGWPDGEIRDDLMRDPESLVWRMAEELSEFEPTHLVLPCADDCHPDHNGCAVIASLALGRMRHPPRSYAYLVHGPARVPPPVVLPLDAAARRHKLEALRSHVTQLALSRRRFEAYVRAEEGYYEDPFVDTTGAATDLRVHRDGDAFRIEIEPVHPPVWRLRRPRLELIWEDEGGGVRARMLKLGRRTPDDVAWRRQGRVLSVDLASSGGVRRLYAKVSTGLHGLWIYDQAGWRRARIVA